MTPPLKSRRIFLPTPSSSKSQRWKCETSNSPTATHITPSIYFVWLSPESTSAFKLVSLSKILESQHRAPRSAETDSIASRTSGTRQRRYTYQHHFEGKHNVCKRARWQTQDLSQSKKRSMMYVHIPQIPISYTPLLNSPLPSSLLLLNIFANYIRAPNHLNFWLRLRAETIPIYYKRSSIMQEDRRKRLYYSMRQRPLWAIISTMKLLYGETVSFTLHCLSYCLQVALFRFGYIFSSRVERAPVK